MLDSLIAIPQLVERDAVDLAGAPEDVWRRVRYGDLARSPLVRSLFKLRTLPDRLRGDHSELSLSLDQLVSSPERPGFQLLGQGPSREVAVGAIGEVWRTQIPFVHVADAGEFASFARPGYVKVAWALRVLPRGLRGSRVELELRVAATSAEAWRNFERYFRVIGPFSRFIRRSLLGELEREFGTLEAAAQKRPMPGDELLRDARSQITQGVTILAPPERIWPWLTQLGCRRAGFYSFDFLDNAGVASARELHPAFSTLHVGQVIPATPDGEDGFEVLFLDEARALVLGGLYDSNSKRQLPFSARRPENYWHVTWSFELEPLDSRNTRVHVRARASYSQTERWHSHWVSPVHRMMQARMLRNLAVRAEDRLPRDSVRDVLEGLRGAAGVLAAAALAPVLRKSRSHWGLDAADAARAYAGDDLIASPRWGWTHAVEIAASVNEVWPWVAQMGADRAGFYSYQWLENLLGCKLRNAERIHPEWQLHAGDSLKLHPEAPALAVVSAQAPEHLLVHARADETARAKGEPWSAVSWLFALEPLGKRRCRLISRFRTDYSQEPRTRLLFGPALLEPVSFAMDRRMLLGIRERAERQRRWATPAFALEDSDLGRERRIES